MRDLEEIKGANAARVEEMSAAKAAEYEDDAAPAEYVLWEILIPMADNSGEEFAQDHHDAFLKQVADMAGGYTVGGVVTGAWRNPVGHMQIERMIPLRMALPVNTTLGANVRLARLCNLTREHYSQQAVMAYRLSETVRFFTGY